MASNSDVVITGLGIISPIGLNVPETLGSFRTNQSGIRRMEPKFLQTKLPVGLIDRDFSQEFSKLELPYLDRCSQIAILSARQAMQDAGIEQFAEYAQRAGVFYGSVGGGVKTEHDWVEQFHDRHEEISKPYTIMACMLNAAPAQISIRHRFMGPVVTHSSACASSGTAIGEGYRAIRHGYLDIALVGGAESAFTEPFLAMWGGLRALAEVNSQDVARSCRPFSKNRTGLVLGEGAVFMIMESREHAARRGARCYCRLSGYGIASDAYHIGSPNVVGQVAALRNALTDAGLQPHQIDYLNAHGTATKGGDPVEVAAICEAFGAAADRLPVSSTKAIHGHLLGAASAMELTAAILAVTQSFLPATAHLDEIDPACQLHHIANNPVFDYSVEHALSFSAGFGGTNVALVVSKERELPGKHSHPVELQSGG